MRLAILAVLALACAPENVPRAPATGTTGAVELRVVSNYTRGWAGVDRLIVRVDRVRGVFEGYGAVEIAAPEKDVDLLGLGPEGFALGAVALPAARMRELRVELSHARAFTGEREHLVGAGEVRTPVLLDFRACDVGLVDIGFDARSSRFGPSPVESKEYTLTPAVQIAEVRTNPRACEPTLLRPGLPERSAAPLP